MWRGSSVGSVSALEAAVPRSTLTLGSIFSLPLIQEKQILAKKWALYTGKLPPRTVMLNTDSLDMTSAVYHERKASNQTNKIFLKC